MKLERVCRLCRRNREGTAAAGFAAVALLSLLLVMGMIEFCRINTARQVVMNASREGAKMGVLDGATTADVEYAVQSYLQGASLQGAHVTVNPDPPSSAAYNAPITVTVSVNFDQVSWLPTPMFLGGQSLTAKAAMRREMVR